MHGSGETTDERDLTSRNPLIYHPMAMFSCMGIPQPMRSTSCTAGYCTLPRRSYCPTPRVQTARRCCEWRRPAVSEHTQGFESNNGFSLANDTAVPMALVFALALHLYSQQATHKSECDIPCRTMAGLRGVAPNCSNVAGTSAVATRLEDPAMKGGNIQGDQGFYPGPDRELKN